MSELVSVRYSNFRAAIPKRIDGMATILEQPRAIDAKMDDSFAVGNLIEWIDVPYLKPVFAAIKTLTQSGVKWETVLERLIEEWRDLNWAYRRWSGKVLTNDGIVRTEHVREYEYKFPYTNRNQVSDDEVTLEVKIGDNYQPESDSYSSDTTERSR